MTFSNFKDFFNPKFESFLKSCGIKDTAFLNMLIYTPLAGGKRLRAFIIYSLGKEMGISDQILLKIGFAVELFHSASLIHDDLPSIDNDNLRRGKESHHVKYGEANAILAGDYLMLLPIKIINSLHLNIEIISEIINLWINCCLNVVRGEYLDVKNDKKLDLNFLHEIYILKTAALFKFCFTVPFIINHEKNIEKAEEIGTDFGISFQILDDIKDEISTSDVLGKTPGKDKEQDKLTILKFISLQEAKKISKEMYFNSLKQISNFGIKKTCDELKTIFDLVEKS